MMLHLITVCDGHLQVAFNSAVRQLLPRKWLVKVVPIYPVIYWEKVILNPDVQEKVDN